MALVFAGDNGLSAVAFTILGDNALQFDITIDSPGTARASEGVETAPLGI